MQSTKFKIDLAIILLNYNGSNDTIECLESLNEMNTNYNFRIYILDNGSKTDDFQLLYNYCKKRDGFVLSDYSQRMVLNPDKCYLLRSEINYGFAKGNNAVARLVMPYSENIVLLNNDTVVDKDFVNKMLHFLQDYPEVKYASCRINNYYNRNLLWNCGGSVKWWGNKHYYTEKELGRKESYIETSFISGCALFLRCSMLEEHGLLTEDFFHGEEDFNFCWRMKKAGVKGACLKETLVYHKVHAASDKTGAKAGKIAAYFLNRIIDMRKFYPRVIWEIWRRIVVLLVIIDSVRKRIPLKTIKQVLNLIKKYSHNMQLTYSDCIEMGRF